MMRSQISKLPFFLLAIMVAILMVATIIEHLYGSQQAYTHVYHSLVFRLLWGIIVVLGTWLILRRKLWRRPSTFLLHLAFIVILGGAVTTSFTAVNGILHLRQGQPTRIFLDDNKEARVLPFDITLRQFQLDHYPGTTAPRDYVSHLTFGDTTHLVVSMNCIGTYQSYRFYQSSYDDDHQGTVLTVNYDPYGIALTYTGYALLLAAMLYSLFDKRGRFRRLLRHPLLRRGAFVMLWVGATSAYAALPAVNRAQADSFATKQVVYNDRVCPLNTLAIDFCKKIYGKPTFQRLSAEQVLLSWIYFPEAWQEAPMIKIKNKALRQRLGIKGNYARLSELFEGDHYRLQDFLLQEKDLNSAQVAAIQEVDEQVGLILMLLKGTLLQRVDDEQARLSDFQVDLELRYNQLHRLPPIFIAQLLLGFLSFLMMVAGVRKPWWHKAFIAAQVCSLLFLLVVFGLRWYIGGHIPMSNGFETLLFMAICSLALTLCLARRFPWLLPAGFLLAGFSLLVAHLGDMNPQITSLVPVLSSPLLSLHVTIIMLSYALLALICMNSGYALWLIARSRPHGSQRIAQLTQLNRVLLYPAVYLLTAGIFVGAVWANISWGRYWGWDPKEVWALITMLIYAFALHGETLPWFRRPRNFHLFLLLAFLCVLITYFGVNFLLGGRHSYA